MATQETIKVVLDAETQQYTNAMNKAAATTRVFTAATKDFKNATDNMRIRAEWGNDIAAAAKKVGVSFNQIKSHISAIEKSMGATKSEAIRLTQAELENAIANAELADAYDDAIRSLDRERLAMQRLRDETAQLEAENNKLEKSVGGFSKKTIGSLSVFGGLAIGVLTKVATSGFSLVAQAAREGLDDVLEWSEATGGSFAATMNTIKSNLASAKNALGGAFAAIVNALSPVINWIIKAVTAAANAVSWLFALISGKKTYIKALPNMAQASESASNTISDAMSNVAEYGETAAESLDNATKSAKELQKALMGFDVIHRLDQEQEVKDSVSPVTGGVGGGDFGGVGDIGEIGGGFVEEEVTEHPIYKFFKNLWEKVKNLWTTFKEWIVEKWTNFKSEAAELWLKIKEKVVGIWEKIKETATDIWTAIKEKVVGVWNTVKDKAVDIWTAIKEKARTLWEQIKEVVGGKAEQLWTKVKGAFETLKANIAEKWNDIKEKARTIWDNIKTVVGGKASQIWGAVSGAFATLKTNIATKWNDVKETARTKWEQIKTAVSGKAGQIWGAISGAFATVKSNIATKWSEIKTAAGTWWISIKNKILNTVSGLWNYIKTPFVTVYNEVKGWWEKITGWIRDIFNKAGNINVHVTGGENFSGKGGSFATGGYVGTGQMFVAREAGPELVGTIGNRTAVANNDQIVASVAQGVASAVASVLGGGGGGATEVNVFMDNQVVARASNRGNALLNRRFSVYAT